MRIPTPIKERIGQLIPVIFLLSTYLVIRIVFQQVSTLKLVFIYPTGVLIKSFFGNGQYINQEWHLVLNQTQFVLGESCSGTTFFSLLCAYLTYLILKRRASLVWLLLAYPITLIANAMRVTSSIYIHNILNEADVSGYHEAVHIFTGTATFFSCLLLTSLLIDKTGIQFTHAK